jgi:hypothetical protein
MLLQRDSANAIGFPYDAVANTEAVGQTAQALGRLLERWKGKAKLEALLRTYTDEVQALEQAIWDVLIKRLPAEAEGVQLDVIGRIIGEPRRGRTDAAYRPWITARIAVNRSFGTAGDVIRALLAIGAGAFTLEDYGTANFKVTYPAPIDAGAEQEIPDIIAAARAAGVGARVAFTSATPLLFRTAGGASTSTNALGTSTGSDAGTGIIGDYRAA